MKNFNKYLHDYGDVRLGESQAKAEFQYLGTEELTTASFKRSCSCTDLDYNPVTKILRAGLDLSAEGIKNTFIAVVLDGKEEYLLLRAKITK